MRRVQGNNWYVAEDLAETVKIVIGSAYGGLALQSALEGNLLVFLISSPLIILFAFIIISIANYARDRALTHQQVDGDVPPEMTKHDYLLDSDGMKI